MNLAIIIMSTTQAVERERPEIFFSPLSLSLYCLISACTCKVIYAVTSDFYKYIYSDLQKFWNPQKKKIDIYLYLHVHLFSGATFREHCFPCDISMELPRRCELHLLGHISLFSETHQNCFQICIYSGELKICANYCVYIYIYIILYIYDLPALTIILFIFSLLPSLWGNWRKHPTKSKIS